MKKAFVLGAGLGTRLKSLTDQLPKPLVPVGQKPLITYAFDHLISQGIEAFVVNTHHRAEAYGRAFPGQCYRGCTITFRNEPDLLETAGGIANVADLFADEDAFIVYNGDILTDFPLQPVMEAHQQSGNLVTLALRSQGPAQHIALDRKTGKVTDIRNRLGTGDPGSFLFTGVYVVSREFLGLLTPGKKESVVAVFLQAIKNENSIGGVVVDEGDWWDLGNRETYLAAHEELIGGKNQDFPRYSGADPLWKRPIHDSASVPDSVRVDAASCVGADARIGEGVVLENSVVWPGGEVESGARLTRCVVRRGQVAQGHLADADV